MRRRYHCAHVRTFFSYYRNAKNQTNVLVRVTDAASVCVHELVVTASVFGPNAWLGRMVTFQGEPGTCGNGDKRTKIVTMVT